MYPGANDCWVNTIISLIPYDTRIMFDTRCLHCKSSLYKLKLPIIIKNKKLVTELASESRNNIKKEPSSRQLILQYLESPIPIPCGASTLRYRYHLTQL